jgi:hypothetical protein
MDPWLVNTPWQNYSSMVRETCDATNAESEVERRHHMTAALYFGIAALEAFLNQKYRAFFTQKQSEEEVMRALRHTPLMDKVKKWPKLLHPSQMAITSVVLDTIAQFNDLRASLTHAKTRGHDVYATLEQASPELVLDTIAQFIVRFHEADQSRYPYWIFGWNYLNPSVTGYEIILLNDQQFACSLSALGVLIPSGFAWEEDWKNKTMKSFDGYMRIRDHLRVVKNCEPKYAEFPLQPKLCRRWWTKDHHRSCGAVLRVSTG